MVSFRASVGLVPRLCRCDYWSRRSWRPSSAWAQLSCTCPGRRP